MLSEITAQSYPPPLLPIDAAVPKKLVLLQGGQSHRSPLGPRGEHLGSGHCCPWGPESSDWIQEGALGWADTTKLTPFLGLICCPNPRLNAALFHSPLAPTQFHPLPRSSTSLANLPGSVGLQGIIVTQEATPASLPVPWQCVVLCIAKENFMTAIKQSPLVERSVLPSRIGLKKCYY